MIANKRRLCERREEPELVSRVHFQGSILDPKRRILRPRQDWDMLCLLATSLLTLSPLDSWS
jgi:hypothetical protein